jgi:hypothetical protein
MRIVRRADKGGGGAGHWAFARRTTKIHALTDAACRPLAFLLTSGQGADRSADTRLLDRLPECDIVHADKGQGL